MNKQINLHTIAEYNGTEYELENLLNDLLYKIDQLEQELQRKDNNWNELKEFILNHYIVGHTVQNSSLDMIINKMKELDSGE